MRKKKWIWALALVAAAAGLLYWRSAAGMVEVRTDRAKRQLLEITVTATATGTLKSDTEIKITAQRVGRVSELPVVEGDVVRKGDVVAELDPAEALIGLNKARASLSRARATLAELRASLEALDAEVKAAVDRAASRFEDASLRYERLRGLYEKGFVSKNEHDAAKTEYEVAKAEHESALAGGAKISARKSEVEAQSAAVREAEEAVKLAELEHDYSYLRAPMAGVITSIPVKLGETVSKGSLVAELIAMESLYIEAFVDEADVDRVRLGQEVYVTMDAYPNRKLKGKVYMISPVVLGAKQETRTFEVRTRMAEGGVELKPGMSADIEIIVGRAENTLSVPSQAVIEREGKRYVYVKEGSRARLREVETGISNWTLTEIKGGIGEDAEVITTPDVKGLEDGSRVKVKEFD